MYDIIFIGNNISSFEKLKEQFPTAKKVTVKTDLLAALNEAKQKAFTKMFWVVWDDIVINPQFKFDYKVEPWDEQYTHVFLNDVSYDGVCLFSKSSEISNRELSYRFFINKKEVDIVASTPKPFDKFIISNYDEYLTALNKSTTDMFWVIPPDIVVDEKFEFNYYVPVYDTFHRNITHVFKNGDYYDGICLFSKSTQISKREFEYRFFTNKKEVDIVASTPKPFDIVFISYFEKFADGNFQKLLEKTKGRRVHRVNGIKGIHNAHRYAAELVETDMFWVVDADAIIKEKFSFDYQVAKFNANTVHVWRSTNPINDLEYGYGGVKLLPKMLTMNMDISKPDMTTSISASFKAMTEVSNVAGFNTDPFTTWRSAFRECVKLASKTIQGQVDQETEDRLNIWCTVGADRKFGNYAIAGAIAGRNYGQENAGNLPALSLINDYDWLKSQFEQTH